MDCHISLPDTCYVNLYIVFNIETVKVLFYMVLFCHTGGIPLWQFLDFVVTVKTPLFMMLLPFIQYKVCDLLRYFDYMVLIQGIL